VFLIISLSYVFLMQFYFVHELRRVRHFLECKSPLELEIKMRNFRRMQIVLAAIAFSGFVVLIFQIFFGQYNPIKNFLYLAFAFLSLQYVIMLTMLIYQSINQYIYFIRRRLESLYINHFTLTLSLFDKFAIFWLLTPLIL
jgi:hypothetical protein